MSWKTELKLADLDATTQIEITCKRCGFSHYVTQAQLLKRADLRHAYLDEVESKLHCPSRSCRGQVRLALVYDDKREGFVGGMA